MMADIVSSADKLAACRYGLVSIWLLLAGCVSLGGNGWLFIGDQLLGLAKQDFGDQEIVMPSFMGTGLQAAQKLGGLVEGLGGGCGITQMLPGHRQNGQIH